MTDEQQPEDSKQKHQAKAAAHELDKSTAANADKLGSQAKEQFEKLSPHARDLSDKVRKNPKFKLISGLLALVILAVALISMLPGGPSSSDVAQALREKLLADAREQSKIAVLQSGPSSSDVAQALREKLLADAREQSKIGVLQWPGGQGYMEEKLAKEEAGIAALEIEIEIINKKEVSEGTWELDSFTTISADGAESKSGDYSYTMRKGKKGWRLADAREQSKIAVPQWHGGQGYMEAKLAKEEAGIAALEIEIEILSKKEVSEGLWEVDSFTTISADGAESKSGDHTYTMRKGKKGWRML